MKILFVCHRLPFPPRRGGKIRPFNIIRHLADQGHKVTSVSLARSPEEADAGAGLSDHCDEVIVETVGSGAAWLRTISRLPTLSPSSMGYFYSSALHRRVRERLAGDRFDLIFVHCSSVAQYVAHVEDVPKVMDFGDMDSQKWLAYSEHRAFPLSIGYWLEGRKLERAERRIAARFDVCTATTRAEMHSLQTLCPPERTGWFPNGVDRDYFQPDGADYDAQTISFVGHMDYFPNQQAMTEFCASVWPTLKRARPQLSLQIVGARPSRAVRALGDLDGVRVTGSVPDVRPFLRDSALTVAPLLIARGTQNKILESLAMGVPVVCSRRAADGVDVVAGEHLLVADEPNEWVEQVCRILDDVALRRRLSDAGRARVTSHHDWGDSMRRVDGLIERAMELH